MHCGYENDALLGRVVQKQQGLVTILEFIEVRLCVPRVYHVVSRQTHLKGTIAMGKGNNSQKNDKKNKKPKQEKTKPAIKK
jgi:hypothetical protein